MKRTCKETGSVFEISDHAQKIYSRMGIPLPQFSPQVRQSRRLAFRNDRKLFERKCDLTGKSIISIYPPDTPFPVYSQEAWWSDKWELPVLDYNPNQSFFEQMHHLRLLTPRIAAFVVYCENCEYTNGGQKNKDCYLIFVSDHNRDCYYSEYISYCSDVVDCTSCLRCELCYLCVDCENCYNCVSCVHTENSNNCYFCFDCKGCSNCFMSEGLRHQQWVWQNEQLSKQEYMQRIEQHELGSYKSFNKCFDGFCAVFKAKAVAFKKILRSEECSGNNILNSQRSYNSFDIFECQDIEYIQIGQQSKDCLDCYVAVDNCELLAETVSCIEANNCYWSVGCWTSNNIQYSEFCQGSHDCFGCISIKHKSYCILNKQYSEADYHALQKKIIVDMKTRGEYGAFFPIKYAPFPYNCSIAGELQPKTKAEVISLGGQWHEEKQYNRPNQASELPDQLPESNDIVGTVLYSKKSSRPYKIAKKELEFYRKLNLPLPRLHYEERYQLRAEFRESQSYI